MKKGTVALMLLLVIVVIGITGCQTAGERSPDRPGYFSWVDEQGRVRQSPIIKEPDAVYSTPPAEDEEYTVDNYPDGNELAAAGFTTPGERLPYFTLRDAEGNLRVSFYQPAAPSGIGLKEPVALTEAAVFRVSDNPVRADEGASEAYLALGIERDAPAYFHQWAGQCCAELPFEYSERWASGREFQLEIGFDAPDYPFLSGVSAYQIVRLPHSEAFSSFVMRIRSFNHNGMFVPSLAFLDEDKQPLRMVTDLVAEYTPESWSKHGFLEALVPAFPQRGERWLLIFTRQQDLDSQAVIESKRGPVAIPHQNYGVLSLEAVED